MHVGGNPAFKLYDVDPDTFEVLDAKVYMGTWVSFALHLSNRVEYLWKNTQPTSPIQPSKLLVVSLRTPLKPIFMALMLGLFLSLHSDMATLLLSPRLLRTPRLLSHEHPTLTHRPSQRILLASPHRSFLYQ